MRVKLNIPTRVNLTAGTVVDVTEEEAKRLFLLRYAEAADGPEVETAVVTPVPKKKPVRKK